MSARLLKIYCYLVVSLQVLASVASAQGLMLCVPADGVAHIENRTQQQDCPKNAKQEKSDKVSLTDATKSCLDLPVGGHGNGALKPAQQAAAQFDASQFIAILPSFLQVALDPFAPATMPRVEATADRVLDAALDSLGSVILVI